MTVTDYSDTQEEYTRMARKKYKKDLTEDMRLPLRQEQIQLPADPYGFISMPGQSRNWKPNELN